MVAALRESGELKGEPTKTMRQTNFFEKGDKPLEIVTSRQWYIRNGGRAWTNPASGQDLNDELIGRGRELEFHPDFMRVRYENWVKGLKGRLAGVASALLRRAVPAVVPRGRGRPGELRRHHHPFRGRAAG